MKQPYTPHPRLPQTYGHCIGVLTPQLILAAHTKLSRPTSSFKVTSLTRTSKTVTDHITLARSVRWFARSSPRRLPPSS
jgi:hypothetical protein